MKFDKMDLIIFGGQSNMQGQCEILTNSDPVEGCLEYRYLTDSVVVLKNPVGEYIKIDGSAGEGFDEKLLAEPGGEEKFIQWLSSTALGAACYGHTNLVPEFCKAYRQASGRNVLAVHAAKGSTKICQWQKGEFGYEMLVKKVNAAKEKCAGVERVYFVWLQGESDACASVTQAEYEEQITALKNNLKEDLSIERFGIIRVGHFAGDERDEKIINAQEAVCRKDDDFIMLTRITSELECTKKYMNPYVSGHYGAKGLELIGEIAGTKLGEEVSCK